MHLKNWGTKMKVILYGYGLMGKKVAHKLRENPQFDLIGIVSYEFDEKAPENMYNSLKEVEDQADVIIDFSHPNNLDDILTYALKNKSKLVIATTGYSQEQLADIEILEKHHNQKIDAPSGTAKLLYEVMEEEIKETKPVYDRSSLHEKRKHEQIGLQAIRGGTIFGEHDIIFAGLDEIIEIKHTALSKDVFVQGAIAAALALKDKESGLFTLKTLY